MSQKARNGDCRSTEVRYMDLTQVKKYHSCYLSVEVYLLLTMA